MIKKYLFLLIIILVAIFIVFIIMKNKNKTDHSYDYTLPITNSWYSSLFFDKFGKTLFTIPLSFKLTESAFEISKTTPVFNEKSIVSAHDPELFIKDVDSSKFIDKEVLTTGEWDVRFSGINDLGKKTIFHVIKGSPVLYFENLSSDVSVSGKVVEVKNISGSYLIKTNLGNNYLLSSRNNITIQNKEIKISSGININTLTLLPEEWKIEAKESNLSVIESCTKIDPKYTTFNIKQTSNENINVDFHFDNDLGNQNKYLFTIWPNQIPREDYKILGSYLTPKGKVNLVCSENLLTKLKIQNLPSGWVNLLDKDKLNDPNNQSLLLDDIKEFEKSPVSAGIYFKGKYLKNLTDLWEISKLSGNKDQEKILFNKLRTLLLSSLSDFYFDEKTEVLKVKNPEFGNEFGNDHHFQYSYYVYSYSKVYSNLNSDEKEKVKDLMVSFVKEGIPGIDQDSVYPRKIRFLDEWESHSWADGRALFDDGNNQESTSEALFYWYSLYLWSLENKDNTLSLWSKYAYFSELSGRDSYWFLVDNTYILEKFSKPITSLVWGSKSDYATWFSPEEDKILGIQLLPINPSSSVSLKLNSETQKRIFRYYDKALGSSPLIHSFYGYYLFFKKINDVPGLPIPKTFDGEFFSQTIFNTLL